MFDSLDNVKNYFNDSMHSTEEKINKTVNDDLAGKYFALTKNRYLRKPKYYGKIIKTQIYQGGDRYGIWTSLSIEYINKTGDPKSIAIRLDGYNDIRLFDDENTAKLFSEVNDN